MNAWKTIRVVLTAGALLGLAACLDAAEPVPAQAPSKVTLNLPEDLDLKVLIEYVGKRQGITFLYDDRLQNIHVTLKAPKELPADSLVSLLDSVLKMKGFMMVPTSTAGVIRIEPTSPLTITSLGPHDVPDPVLAGLALTRIFELKHASAKRAEDVLKPFLSAATANIISLEETGVLIVTDYAGNFKRLEGLMETIDRPNRAVIRSVRVTNLDAPALLQQVTQLLAAKGKIFGGAVTVLADDRTNQLFIVGPDAEAAETVELVRSLDVPVPGMETRTYVLAHASPEQLDRLARKQIGEVAAKRFYRATPDADAGLLVVAATPEVHAQIEILRLALDKQKADQETPIRFYKMKNAKASQVLAAIRGVLGETGLTGTSLDGATAKPPEGPKELVIKGPNEQTVNTPDVIREKPPEAKTSPSASSLILKDARLMADETTNTIIVVAPPSAQSIYEKLIERLDILQPQVLIEATVVIIDTSDDFSLGVELGKEFSVSGGKSLVFSSFGLSTRDPATGALTLKPGVGFNGVMLSPDIADVVIRALQADSHARIVSRPSVLVNDNATGALVSESEEPFSSQNTVNTVTSTSFAGYASAGTKIKVTPQISQGEHLSLKYEVTLSSFDASRADALPPPRQTNTMTSEVTVPNGSTIVVGGLTRENYSQSVDRVPGLGSIPGLEYLFSNRTRSTTRDTLFVFIRAVILRDDKFESLKVLSHEALEHAGLKDQYPTSEPVEMR
jgi:general secretion pathway protein D